MRATTALSARSPIPAATPASISAISCSTTLSAKGRGASTGKWGHRHWRNALYFQDDWKARRNLTINLGMRWEYISPVYEVADRQVNINTYTGALIYPGKNGYGRALYSPYYKQFMPTIGVAWTPDIFKNKLVVRAGYRFSSFLEGTGANLRLPLNPPFFIESNVNYDARTPGDIRTGFSDVIGAGDLTGPRPAPRRSIRRAPGISTCARSSPTSSTSHWSTSWRARPRSRSAYVGNRATHLIVPHEANQPLPGAGPFATWAPLNDRRPLALVAAQRRQHCPDGIERHQPLQLAAGDCCGTAMSGGLELIAAYTYSQDAD